MSSVATASLVLRNFSMQDDSAWLLQLWHRALHARWAISLRSMQRILFEADLQLVAEDNGVRSGFCAVDTRIQGTAALLLLLVDPYKQRRGIGAELVRRVEVRLREQRAARLDLGAGTHGYFWPRLPHEQITVWPFFANQGFQEEDSSEDLIQSLEGFRTPAWVSARQLTTATTLHLADSYSAADINAFEQRYFPSWSPYFETEMKQGGFGNVLYAKGRDQLIVGTILLRQDAIVLWQEAEGTQVGTLNTLGVAPEKQGAGVGLALAAGAMEHLRDRGCSSCYIQWTGLTDWYGKLGAKLWASYHMASKRL